MSTGIEAIARCSIHIGADQLVLGNGMSHLRGVLLWYSVAARLLGSIDKGARLEEE